MSYEVRVTRGRRFDDPGPRPITEVEWSALVASTPVLEALCAPGGGLTFGAGMLGFRSPPAEVFSVLFGVAATLRARIFGEDGHEYLADALGDVTRTLRVGFPQVPVGALTAAHGAALHVLDDPRASAAAKSGAEASIAALDSDARRAALAWLVCRAVECAGDPDPAVTNAAARLLPTDPRLLAGLRRKPTDAWAAEVELRSRERLQPG